ncbi:MAG: Nif3-like dinuclear metal center hexameric protein [Patescibacteria group bacterium]
MEKLNKIIKFLDDYLQVKEVDDKSWNGLQVEGSEEVDKIAFCVTAGAEVFKEVLEEDPDLIISHHGIFWKGANPSIKSWMKGRVEPLIKTNTSLYGVHLPLDKHEEVGNNAQLLKKLSIKPKKQFGEIESGYVGWMGETNQDIFDLLDDLEAELDTECKLLNFGSQTVEKVGVVSGSGGKYIYEAMEKDLDLLITGEETDLAEVARDGKINVIFAGHYATETLGVIALKEKIQKKFSVDTVFLDFPTSL